MFDHLFYFHPALQSALVLIVISVSQHYFNNFLMESYRSSSSLSVRTLGDSEPDQTEGDQLHRDLKQLMMSTINTQHLYIVTMTELLVATSR